MDGEDFVWHYDAHCPWCSNDVFTAGRQGQPHVLFIDPFPWGFELRPKSVAEAIRWAFRQGWTPEAGPTRSMAFNDDTSEFEWLADGQRHRACVGPAPDDV